MPQNIPSVELLESKSIELFIPVLREVDLGDRFLLAMLHWCGIGQRSTPLDYWQVFLVQRTGETVGVAGLYRQPQTEKDICWIGWFGVRPAFRRQGIGTSTIQNLIAAAKKIGCRTLWVYTGTDAQAAIQFYKKLGFTVVGPAGQCAPGQTMDDSDLVLKRSV